MKGVSISTAIFGPAGLDILPLEIALEGVAEAGYRSVEISRKHRLLPQHPAAIESRGLNVWAIHGNLKPASMSADDAVRRQAVEKERVRLEEAAPFAPCPYVIHYLNRVHDPAAGDSFRRSVEDLLKRAEALNINLSIETVPDKDSNERYADTREVADFARAFASPFVSVCLDLNHSNLAEDLGQAAKHCAGVISDIHVSDNHGQVEEHLPPGEGAINLLEALQAVADAGYAGPLNLECHTPGYPSRGELVRMREWAEKTSAELRR